MILLAVAMRPYGRHCEVVHIPVSPTFGVKSLYDCVDECTYALTGGPTSGISLTIASWRRISRRWNCGHYEIVKDARVVDNRHDYSMGTAGRELLGYAVTIHS
jgi:hypothetical protein